MGPVLNPPSPKVNGVHKVASPSKPHFLDTGFKDAEVNVLSSIFIYLVDFPNYSMETRVYFLRFHQLFNGNKSTP